METSVLAVMCSSLYLAHVVALYPRIYFVNAASLSNSSHFLSITVSNQDFISQNVKIRVFQIDRALHVSADKVPFLSKFIVKFKRY